MAKINTKNILAAPGREGKQLSVYVEKDIAEMLKYIGGTYTKGVHMAFVALRKDIEKAYLNTMQSRKKAAEKEKESRKATKKVRKVKA